MERRASRPRLPAALGDFLDVEGSVRNFRPPRYLPRLLARYTELQILRAPFPILSPAMAYAFHALLMTSRISNFRERLVSAEQQYSSQVSFDPSL